MRDTTRRRVGPEPIHPAQESERQRSVRALADGLKSQRGPLLPILHAVVEEHGFVDDGDIPVIADVLNLSRADVHGVVTFYEDFRRTPPTTHRITLCRAEACQSVGGAQLFAAVSDRYAASQDVEVSEVFCLGNCALGPSGVIDGQLHGRLTSDRVDDLLDSQEAGQ